jgi:hypothetical protein
LTQVEVFCTTFTLLATFFGKDDDGLLLLLLLLLIKRECEQQAESLQAYSNLPEGSPACLT